MSRLGILAALAFLVVTAVACSGSAQQSPESTVRAWIKAVARGDNETAASFFLRGATVAQAGTTLVLRTHADAVAWNAALPCSADIEEVTALEPGYIRVRFRLADSKTRGCDGPGAEVEVDFMVSEGRITSFHQRGATLELTD